MLQPRVTGLRVESSFRVRMQFSDGTEGVADLESWIAGRTGVFLPLQDAAYFALVRVDEAAGTLVWPNGVDLDPDMLYDAAHASS